MSRKPPIPFVIFMVEESLTPTQRLNLDSTRSPNVPTSAAVTPQTSDLTIPKCVPPIKQHETRQEAKTDPASPSQLLFGEIVGQSLWLPPFISFAEVSPNAKPPTSENFTTATT